MEGHILLRRKRPVKKLMQLLGFYGDEDYNEPEEHYPENPQSFKKGRKREEIRPQGPLRMVFFKGVPSEEIKLRLRDILLDGVMVLLDLHELDPHTFEEEGRSFINFMGGVAFAHRGRMEFIEPALYIVTPHEGMFEEWAEEGLGHAGSFDRQGR